jgi:hypothetical protein
MLNFFRKIGVNKFLYRDLVCVSHIHWDIRTNGIYIINSELKRGSLYAEYEVLTAVVVKSTIYWDITPCSPLKVNRRFEGTYCLLLLGHKISRARNKRGSMWQASIRHVACISASPLLLRKHNEIFFLFWFLIRRIYCFLRDPHSS